MLCEETVVVGDHQEAEGVLQAADVEPTLSAVIAIPVEELDDDGETISELNSGLDPTYDYVNYSDSSRKLAANSSDKLYQSVGARNVTSRTSYTELLPVTFNYLVPVDEEE